MFFNSCDYGGDTKRETHKNTQGNEKCMLNLVEEAQAEEIIWDI
jgi:hypothetical protein